MLRFARALPRSYSCQQSRAATAKFSTVESYPYANRSFKLHKPLPIKDKLPFQLKSPATNSIATLSHVLSLSTAPLIEQNVSQWFTGQVAKFGDRELLRVVHQDIRWSWSELDGQAEAFAVGLRDKLGVKPGDRVGVWLHNTAEWVVAQFATAKAGAVLVNINPAYRSSEVENALQQVGVSVLIVTPTFLKSNYVDILSAVIPELRKPGIKPGEWQAPTMPKLKHLVQIGKDQIPGFHRFEDILVKDVAASDRQQLKEVAQTTKNTDAVNIQFTSGTTGLPKGATLTHRNILNNGYFIGEKMKLTPNDGLCIPVPLYHCFGLVLGNLAAMSHGARIAYPSGQFDAQACLATVQEEKLTGLHGVPTMFISMLNHPNFSKYNLSSLRTGIMAGSPCPVEVMKRVMSEMNMRDVTICYGMTETSPVSFQTEVDDPVNKRVETVGRVHEHCEVRAVDQEGKTTTVGTPGELWTRGYNVMKGYWDSPAKTDEVLTSDGWMKTGDTGVIDELGYCRIVGRVKDMIIRGGENIYPREIEEFLFTHPAIADVQAVGVPDKKYGEQVCVWIKLKNPANTLTQQEVQDFCKEKIAHYKIPRYVLFVEKFPMTITVSMNKDEKADHLCLAGNHSVQKMLNKMGKNTPMPEAVAFSDFVIKINRRGKEQTRVMLVTNKGVYNLLPNNYSRCKRRIAIENIAGITASQISDEFVLHVPDEYDYRFKSAKKERITEILGSLYKKLLEKGGGGSGKGAKKQKLTTTYISQSDLKEKAMTKVQARTQTREDIMRRKAQLVAAQHDGDSDKEEDDGDDEKKDKITQLMDNTEKVRLEDFDLLKVLGRGSFGKVMQVKKKSDGKIYAMKILKKRAIVARNQVEHTKAERKILQALQHPFLMTLRYAFQSKEKLYFVLDYFQGGELFFHLKNNRRFPEDVARIYVGEIGLALGHLHSLNVIYRDLKPENILLDDNGHVCLTDFGLSKDVDPNDKAHTFCGTPEYLAPEIVTGAGHDKAVDWWSLGILLYELTVGIPPFYSQNVNEMYNKIQHGVLRFPPFLSDNCKSLIVGLLNRDPKKRLGSKDDVEDIKSHPFFKDLSWAKVMKKDIDVPYKPKVKAADDTSNFDNTFTNEPVVDSMIASSALSQTMGADGDAFGGFTYQSRGGHL